MSRMRTATFKVFLTAAIGLFASLGWGREARSLIMLASDVNVQNVAEPFDYFTNSWGVIGLKDYPHGTRITPKGELVLADGLLCRPLIGNPTVPLNWQVKKTLRDGHLPIVRLDFIANHITRYTIEAFACPLDPRKKDGYDWPSEANFLNLMRVTVENLAADQTVAYFGLEWQSKKGKLDCQLKKVLATDSIAIYSGSDLLCLVRLPESADAAVKDSQIRISLRLRARESRIIEVCAPFERVINPSDDVLRSLAGFDFKDAENRTISFWQELLGRGAQLEVPEKKPMETYKASLVYQFIGRDEGVVHAGEGFYDQLYLRDGAYQAISLAHAGYLDAARQSIEHFLHFQDKDGFFCTQKGQLDGHGYAVWALVEYYRLSGEIEWLRRVYPQIKKAVDWIQNARRKEQNPTSPFFGVLPAAVADGEYLWDGKHHIVGYDWWNLRAVQSAADAARALGETGDVETFSKEFEEYRRCILQAIERTGLPHIPPSYEKAGTHWGNLEAIFPSLLIEPQDRRLTATLEYVRNKFGAIEGEKGGFCEGIIRWSAPKREAIHPYMSQFVTNSHIIRGEYEKAVDGFYSFLLHTTSAHGFPEGVYWKRREAWNNTLPHLWAAALYVTTLRNVLVREEGDVLHLMSCVPVHWLDEGKRVAVTGAPTHFGETTFIATAERGVIRMKIVPPRRTPAARLVIHIPKGIEIQSAEANGKEIKHDGQTVSCDGTLAAEPCVLTLRIKRAPDGVPITFERKVAEYEAEAPDLRNR